MSPERDDLLRTGGLAGAAAFVVGIVLTTLLESDLTDPNTELFRAENLQGSVAPGQESGETMTYGDITDLSAEVPETITVSEPSSFQLAGWIYHRAHFASVEGALSFAVEGDGMEQSTAGDLVFLQEPSTLVYLVPLVVVGAAGYWVSQQFDPESPDVAAKYGAFVAAGYAAVAVVSLFVLSWETGGTGPLESAFVEAQLTVSLSAGPDAASAVLFTGVGYPVVVGAAGAYVGHEYQSD